MAPTVRSVVDSADESTGRRGLTTPQREALACAVRHGYFEIPRRISLEELAAELGVTHQALSERLRRASDTLAAAELGVDADSSAR
ncbi:helix-turn-helix domain-containing protein [Natronococcus pandeyae]|uniref:helix-turn-helix domain-containing protein n=1 Tax=Natronococcus pandeyae TaxID=2055836 RepID=UPI003743A755